VSRDPFDVLGIPAGSGVEMIHEARRRLAKERHPDAGGSVDAMQELNTAVEAALAAAQAPGEAGASRAVPQPRPRPGSPPPRGGVRRDHPSFTIEALPAEAFEGLLLAAARLGEVVDDDPPYLLEAVVSEPHRAWCRLELVPDAGSVTVSITTARVPGHPTPDVLDVRDVWIDALNELDWTDPASSPMP